LKHIVRANKKRKNIFSLLTLKIAMQNTWTKYLKKKVKVKLKVKIKVTTIGNK